MHVKNPSKSLWCWVEQSGTVSSFDSSWTKPDTEICCTVEYGAECRLAVAVRWGHNHRSSSNNIRLPFQENPWQYPLNRDFCVGSLTFTVTLRESARMSPSWPIRSFIFWHIHNTTWKKPHVGAVLYNKNAVKQNVSSTLCIPVLHQQLSWDSTYFQGRLHFQ